MDFWAPWCGPCRSVAPIVDDLATQYAGKLKVAKINVDESTRGRHAVPVTSIPTFILFKNGAGRGPGARRPARAASSSSSSTATLMRRAPDERGKYRGPTEAPFSFSDGAARSPAFRRPAEPSRPSRPSPLDTLWFQVAGTLCNLQCTHCFISCSPTNHRPRDADARGRANAAPSKRPALGVREYYFTGGEPFLNPEMLTILEETLAQGPATVLTNGAAARRPSAAGGCGELADASEYSLDLRVSIDGYSTRGERPDPRRRHLRADPGRRSRNLAHAGLNPVITVTEACDGAGNRGGVARASSTGCGAIGLAQPRLKILPLFRIGAEESRLRGYEPWETLRGRHAHRRGG